MSQTLPADAMLASVPSINPKFIQEMIEDPDAARSWSRVNAVLQFQALITRASDADFSPSLRLKLAESLAKMGGLTNERAGAVTSQDRPFVNIVFSNTDQSVSILPHTEVIDG